MALGTNQMTTSNKSVFLPEIWTRLVQRATEDNLVMADLVFRLDDEAAGGGDKLHVPKVTNLSTNSKSANTAVTLQAATDTEFTLTIDQHHEASFMVEDLASVQSSYNILNQYTSKAGFAIAEKVDTDLHALESGLSTEVDSGTAITEANLIKAIRNLDENNVPMMDRHLVIDAYGREDLHGIDDFTRFDALGEGGGGSPIRTGFQGTLYGINIHMSNNVATTSGTPDEADTLLFHREAFAAAIQNGPRVQSDYDLEFLGNLVVVDVVYGVAEYRDDHAVRFVYDKS